MVRRAREETSGKKKSKTKTRADKGAGESLHTDKRGPTKGFSTIDQTQLLALVCGYLCRGYPVAKIKEEVAKRFGIRMSREKPYQLVAAAARRGWLQFNAPADHAMREQLMNRHRGLHDVRVVQTVIPDDVARAGARMLLDVLQQHYAGKEVHLGFSGGYAMRTFARKFAELLRQPAPRLPAKIVFHALVAGFDVNDPTTDPNAFFSYFVRDPAMQVDTGFVALHAPAIVESEEQLSRLKGLQLIREAYNRVKEVEIIVTSASRWRDDHSALNLYMKVSGESVSQFEEAGCVGDMLWLPLGLAGPVSIPARIRAMTLMELSEIRTFVEKGKRVLLVAGPCGQCHQPKTEIVDAILKQANPLITHLVIDSRCAGELLRSVP